MPMLPVELMMIDPTARMLLPSPTDNTDPCAYVTLPSDAYRLDSGTLYAMAILSFGECWYIYRVSIQNLTG